MDPGLICVGELSRHDYLRVGKNDSLKELVKALLKEGTDRALVFNDGKLEGVVTVKDIISRIASTKRRRIIPLTTLHVSSVMSSPVITLPHTASVLKAAKVMIDEDVSGVAVEDGEGNISLFTKWGIAEILKKDGSPVKEVVRAAPKALRETDSLIMARKVVLEDNPLIPVVSSEGRIIGVLTPEVVLKSLGELVDFLAKHGAKNSLSKVVVGEIMRPLIPSAGLSSSVGDVASLMIDKVVKGVLVFEDDRIVGFTTLTDLTKYLIPP